MNIKVGKDLLVLYLMVSVHTRTCLSLVPSVAVLYFAFFQPFFLICCLLNFCFNSFNFYLFSRKNLIHVVSLVRRVVHLWTNFFVELRCLSSYLSLNFGVTNAFQLNTRSKMGIITRPTITNSVQNQLLATFIGWVQRNSQYPNLWGIKLVLLIFHQLISPMYCMVLRPDGRRQVS